MKHTITALTISTFVLFGNTANAGTVNGTTVDHYTTKTKNIPHTERVCKNVEVPIYGKKEMDTEGAIIGGLIGGVIGNQIGKGGGKEAATGVGALTGAIIGGKGGKEQIVGYRQEQRCSDKVTYTTQTEEVYSHSTITFWDNGKKYHLSFKK